MKQYDKVEDLFLNGGTSLVVIDDFIEFKVSKTDTGYKILILENKCCDIDVHFSDDVKEFENDADEE